MDCVQLRQWRDADLEPFIAMNGDPEVMQCFPATLRTEESEDLFLRTRKLIEERGWGRWAVEVNGDFAGFTGLDIPSYETPFTPCVEIAWRFRREFWGRSVAYRAALQALEFGFDRLNLGEIVAFTAVANERSRRLMERLGFKREIEGDFDHPRLPAGHPLLRHVLYRMTQDRYRSVVQPTAGPSGSPSVTGR